MVEKGASCRCIVARLSTQLVPLGCCGGHYACAYLLPAALGDASLASLPPEAGLYLLVRQLGLLNLLRLTIHRRFRYTHDPFWHEPVVAQTREKSRGSKPAANKIDAVGLV